MEKMMPNGSASGNMPPNPPMHHSMIDPNMVIHNNNTMQMQAQPEEESISQNGSIDTGIDCMEVDQPASDTIPLDPEEATQIDDIVQSYKSSLEVCSENLPPPEEKNSVSDLINVCEVSIRRVIDMAKKIKMFKNLPQSTQICLLKGGSIELLIIRSVLTFDRERQLFLEQTDNPQTSALTLDQFKSAATKENPNVQPGRAIDPMLQFSLVEDIMKFIKVLSLELKADETMLIFLLLISLFSPDRQNLEQRELKDAVAREQEKYSALLRRYVESKMPVGKARSEEHTSELQSRETISYAVFCLKKKKNITTIYFIPHTPDSTTYPSTPMHLC